MTSSAGLVGVEISPVAQLGQLTVGVQMTDSFNCWASKFLPSPGLGSWLLKFKSLIEGRSLYIGPFCPAMKSLSSKHVYFSMVFLEVYYGHSFFYCFNFMSFPK